MTGDWMAGGVVENDRAESLAARDRPLPQHYGCPLDCRCHDCIRAELDPRDLA